MTDHYYRGFLIQEDKNPDTGMVTFIAVAPPGCFSSLQAAEGAIQQELERREELERQKLEMADDESGDEPPSGWRP